MRAFVELTRIGDLMKQSFMGWMLVAALAQTAPGRALEDLKAAAGFAFPSVQEGASARAIALGSTYVGIAEGSAALLWNPAGLSTLQRPEIALHHTSALLGAIQEIAVLGLPLSHGDSLGLALSYEDNGAFEGRDATGAQTGDYRAGAFGANLGWGIALPEGLSLGLAVKANHRDLAGQGANAFAGDFGMLWSPCPELSLGAAYTNLGPDVEGSHLAQGLRLGLSSTLYKGFNHQWVGAVSGEALSYGDSSLHFGLEHTFYRLLSLRGGYAFSLSRPQAAGLLGWTLGGGVQLNRLSLDYAFVPLAALGNMQRVSLTYAFGEARLTRSAEAEPEPQVEATRLQPVEVIPAPQAVATPEAEPMPTALAPGGSYVVKPGDSLWKISGDRRVLGDSYRWPLLYKLNRDQIVDPDLIEAKQDLKFNTSYSAGEIDAAVQKAQDTPRYVPHTAPRKPLEVNTHD